jgi:hypothetical protein
MVIDFKARLFFDSTICAADIRQKIEAPFRPCLQKRTRCDDVLSRNDDRRLAERIDHFADPLGMFTL